jgi:hypothetical protein
MPTLKLGKVLCVHLCNQKLEFDIQDFDVVVFLE